MRGSLGNGNRSGLAYMRWREVVRCVLAVDSCRRRNRERLAAGRFLFLGHAVVGVDDESAQSFGRRHDGMSGMRRLRH